MGPAFKSSESCNIVVSKSSANVDAGVDFFLQYV